MNVVYKGRLSVVRIEEHGKNAYYYSAETGEFLFRLAPGQRRRELPWTMHTTYDPTRTGWWHDFKHNRYYFLGWT